jgi:hypothetical protein
MDGRELMNVVRRLAVITAAALVMQSAGALELENFGINADVTATLDDNQSQAGRSRDKVEDVSLSARANLSWFRHVGQRNLIILSGFAEGERFADITPLDRNSFGASLAWRWQPHSGFSAPLVEWNLSVQDDDYQVDQRDSTVLRSQLFVTRRITDRITMSAGVEYRQRQSRSTVFDLEDIRAFWNFDYLFLQKYAFYTTYSYLTGDIVSSAQQVFCNGVPAVDILPLINAATAIEPDQAYNEALCGTWIAYRLDGTTHALTAGLNMPFGKSASLDFSLMHVDVSADLGNRYERNLIRASLLKRF